MEMAHGVLAVIQLVEETQAVSKRHLLLVALLPLSVHSKGKKSTGLDYIVY
jgi:hypothetical protein